MLKFSEIFEFSTEKFRKIPILKKFGWFEWFEWFGPSHRTVQLWCKVCPLPAHRFPRCGVRRNGIGSRRSSQERIDRHVPWGRPFVRTKYRIRFLKVTRYPRNPKDLSKIRDIFATPHLSFFSSIYSQVMSLNQKMCKFAFSL